MDDKVITLQLRPQEAWAILRAIGSATMADEQRDAADAESRIIDKEDLVPLSWAMERLSKILHERIEGQGVKL